MLGLVGNASAMVVSDTPLRTGALGVGIQATVDVLVVA